ncbi:ABC transporter G family member 25 [Canna indica]|uniref:ABC transporter G family member 25 n=1 Tax=Canna indica TaxID=4628 RepID=A0AAQ3KLR0_9LILI|nr:ABC transporter G family member 25 [Canna indica]
MASFRRACPRPGGTSFLRRRILVVLPGLPSHIHLPAGAHHADQGAVLRHVPPLLILRGADGRRPPHGAHPSYHLRHHYLMDGQPEARRGQLLHQPRRPPLERAGGARPGARARRSRHGPQGGHHPRARCSCSPSCSPADTSCKTSRPSSPGSSTSPLATTPSSWRSLRSTRPVTPTRARPS